MNKSPTTALLLMLLGALSLSGCGAPHLAGGPASPVIITEIATTTAGAVDTETPPATMLTPMDTTVANLTPTTAAVEAINSAIDSYSLAVLDRNNSAVLGFLTSQAINELNGPTQAVVQLEDASGPQYVSYAYAIDSTEPASATYPDGGYHVTVTFTLPANAAAGLTSIQHLLFIPYNGQWLVDDVRFGP